MYLNDAKNHHYVSQTEQRLNAANPDAPPRNQRIYAFEVSDREKPVLKLLDPRGTKIETNLSCFDLFSFEVVDSRYRQNLEHLFGKYERDVAQKSQALVSKLRSGSQDISAEILGVFAMKLLNFFRNPYCVRKAMDTVGLAARYGPTDPELKAAYDAVLNGSKPHAALICEAFDLTQDLYEGWLRALFVLLMPVDPISLFERLLKGQFEGSYVMARVFDYTESEANSVCLLSDRGFNTPLETKNSWAFEFNLRARSFASFYLSDLGEYESVPDDVKAKMRGQVVVDYVPNDLRFLAAYNQRTAYQCAKKVFAAAVAPRLTAP